MTELKVTQRRHYSAHNDLLRVGSNFLYACEIDERFCSEGHFVCLVMCALAVEALCNTTGEFVFPDWQVDFESSSPKAKIRIICEKLNIEYDRGVEPFQTMHWLLKFRNKIAHAKPEPILKENLISQAEFEELRASDGPQSKIEQDITIANAQRALSKIEQFIEMLVAKLPEEQGWLIESDTHEMWSEPNKGS